METIGENHVKIIAIVGMAGSGKTTVCNFLKGKGLPVLRFGDETDIGLRALGMELNEKNEKRYREKLRRELGMAAYAIKIKPRIEKAAQTNKLIILDGLYSWEEYEVLKKEFKYLFLLGVYTRPELRYRRLFGRLVRRLKPQEARVRDIAELVVSNKGGPIALCDYLIKNESNLANLKKEVERVYQMILKKE